MALNGINLKISEFAIKKASSAAKIDDILNEISGINKKGSGLIQIFNTDSVISRVHLLGAYADAAMAFKEKRNVSSTVAVEMLLYAAMTRQIGDAIKMMGAKSNRSFVLFASSQAALSKLKDTIKIQGDFNPTQTKSLEVAKRFEISQKEDLDDFVLQKMALALLD